MDFVTGAYLWMGIGILLILSEFIVPGFLICFFGLSSLLIAGVMFFIPELPWFWQIAIFAGGGTALLLIGRKIAPASLKGKITAANGDVEGDSVAGAVGVVVDDIDPALGGKVDFRGSLWQAEADEPITAGTTVVVLERNNIRLKVSALNKNQKP